MPKKYFVIAKDFHSPLVRNELFVGFNSFWTEWYDLAPPPLGMYSVKNKIEYFTDLDKWSLTKDSFQKKVEIDPSILAEVIRKTDEMGEEMNAFTQKILEDSSAEWSQEELVKFYKKFAFFQSRQYAIGILLPLIDIAGVSFLETYLNEYLSEHLTDAEAKEAYSLFTQPVENSFAFDQELDLLKLASRAFDIEDCKKVFTNNDPQNVPDILAEKFPEIHKALEAHTKKHAWVYYVYAGPSFKSSQFAEFIADMARKDKDPNKELKLHEKERKELLVKREEYLKKMNPNDHDKELIELVSKFVRSKPRRKDYQSLSYYHMERFYRDLAKSTGISLKHARSATIDQIETGLMTNKMDMKVLDEQYQEHLCFFDGDKTLILSGSEAKSFRENQVDQEEFNADDVDHIEGSTAFPGKAKGIVRVINTREEMEKMQDGDILVSIATTPNIVPAMKKAAAIVTNEGGLTCHAAIVSRELKTPCVVGTGHAAEILKDGMEVEVDAEKGIVKIL